MSKNNYKVPGTKMTSRFGMSHRELRSAFKMAATFGPPREHTIHYIPLRIMRTCKHDHMVDTSHGGPEGGNVSGHCAKCGWSFNTQLY